MADYRIYRYRVPITDRPVLQLPQGHHVLSVGPSRDDADELDLWAVVDPEQPDVDLRLAVRGTGHPLDRHDDESFTFLGTAPHADGALIFHVFEVHAQHGHDGIRRPLKGATQ